MERRLTNLLVTGGAGFIGSNFVISLFERGDFNGTVINLDACTYAGNPSTLAGIEREFGGDRYFFVKGDIREAECVSEIFTRYRIDTVVHFAAESHVDRSISGPGEFISTNVNGTFTLLEAARAAWEGRDDVLFHHVSTDEVFGSLGASGVFTEKTPYDPRSPYSASKAASDHLVRAYGHTYGIPITISNCSNNYGPRQFPEKLIPLMILNVLEEKPLPVYGDGKNVRDWLYVDDHNDAIWTVLSESPPGETWCIGGENEWKNIDLVRFLCRTVASKIGRNPDAAEGLISFVRDRPGHDRRYAIDPAYIRKQLGWSPTIQFEEGLEKTVDWYVGNRDWVDSVRTGRYRDWLAEQYDP